MTLCILQVRTRSYTSFFAFTANLLQIAVNRLLHIHNPRIYSRPNVKSFAQIACLTTWEEQQKMDSLRKVYHRAVQIPLENVEKLLSELEAFENSLNKITAKKFMSDLSPSYIQARTVLRQLQHHLGPLFPPPPASSSARPELYLPPTPSFNAAERALVRAWKTYLKWEESNPLEFEDKDKATLSTSRIQGVYRKAVILMRFYAEIWYMSFVWTNSVGRTEQALNILKSGMEANPTSSLLHFAYCELQESRKEHAEVTATFDKFLDALRAELDVLSWMSSNIVLLPPIHPSRLMPPAVLCLTRALQLETVQGRWKRERSPIIRPLLLKRPVRSLQKSKSSPTEDKNTV
ncbi:hypothetical protein K503DRAFT_777066 [Rhizopogon vinicolor AM-OR11-026]|uniref:mRNA 3'-end-processing protein RNA14 n=1 Tax=Rhizopogon vinicolor AM-OR11-026 TaxID=1314800 RepID=A0A1B7MHG6_9AGAM|nr:hypothetical protein K503DRAFT_777066 [Rhizopogon vinicolor AM-OR11-026]